MASPENLVKKLINRLPDPVLSDAFYDNGNAPWDAEAADHDEPWQYQPYHLDEIAKVNLKLFILRYEGEKGPFRHIMSDKTDSSVEDQKQVAEIKKADAEKYEGAPAREGRWGDLAEQYKDAKYNLSDLEKARLEFLKWRRAGEIGPIRQGTLLSSEIKLPNLDQAA